ncbi:MAG: hypothetical protein R3248_03690 [Candidatus Promineifilaceae bacterium]|nr:hypothetical protein [Candidatus Promineifilaceae bacterium]
MEEERVVGLTLGIIIGLVLMIACGVLTFTLLFLTVLMGLAI